MISNMKRIFLFCFVLLLLSCKEESYKPEGLHFVTQEEIIEMVKDGRFPSGDHTLIKNERGEIISRDSILNIPNLSENWTLDMYINEDFELVEMVLRPATEEDNKFKERLQVEVIGQ